MSDDLKQPLNEGIEPQVICMTHNSASFKVWLLDIVNNCPLAVKIGLRLLVNYLLMLMLPVYLFLIYMLHNGLFSYDFFNSGKFGMSTFFHLIIAFMIYFAFLLVLPANYIHEIRKNYKSWIDWILCILFMGLNVLLYSIFYSYLDKELFLGIIIPSIVFLVVAVLAFETTIKKYLIVLVFSSILLTLLPVMYVEIASKVVGLSLSNFGVGGGLPVTIHSSKNEQVYKGELILLSPSTVYIRDASNSMLIFERNADLYIELIDVNKKKKSFK